MILKLLIVVLSFVNLINCGPSNATQFPPDCPRRLKVMDNMAKILLIVTNPKQKMYETAEQFNTEYCLPSKDQMKKIADYRPCLKAFPRQLFNIVYKNCKDNVKKFCSTPEGRQDFVANLKCMSYDTFPQVIQLSHQSTALVETVLKYPNIDDIIPGICCGYYDVYKEASTLLNRLCSAPGGPGKRGADYFIKLFHDGLQDAIDIMCGAYSDIATCEQKVPHLVKSLRVNVFNKSIKYDHTLMVPFLGVINRIDQDKTLPSRSLN